MAAELTSYITKAREKNIPDEEIKNQLVSVGWPSEQVAAALSQAADLPVPPPPPDIAHVGMWVGFLYILFFISLYVLSTAIGGIFDVMVNKVIPNALSNPLDFTDYSFTDILSSLYGGDIAPLVRGYLSAIIVSYPLFLLFSLTLRKQLIKQPVVRNLRSRKILIYITLIATFLIMLGNIISTSYDFLAGTITNNALGHVAVTILIAGSIFGYFISEVKHDSKTG